MHFQSRIFCTFNPQLKDTAYFIVVGTQTLKVCQWENNIHISCLRLRSV